jgi:hypothetical protein
MPLMDHPSGDYGFLPGIAPYSCGVASKPGFEIAHVTLHRPVSYAQGFQVIETHLADEGRPKAALCGIELRSPAPFSFQGFGEFNAEYARILEGWGLLVEGVNPVARTNVAPAVAPPTEPVLYGLSYSRPCDPSLPPTLVVAGAGNCPRASWTPVADPLGHRRVGGDQAVQARGLPRPHPPDTGGQSREDARSPGHGGLAGTEAGVGGEERGRGLVEGEEDEIGPGYQAQELAALGEDVEVVRLDLGPEVVPPEGRGGDLSFGSADVPPRVEHLAAEIALGNEVTIDADDRREAHSHRRQGDVGAVTAEADDEEAAVEDVGRERQLEGGNEILRMKVIGHCQVPSSVGDTPSRLATWMSATG